MTQFTLRKVRINQGGYDSSGRYWGTGDPLYHFQADYPDSAWSDHKSDCHALNTSLDLLAEIRDCQQKYQAPFACPWCGRYARLERNDVSDHIRAFDREHAKAKIKAKYPDATFAR